MSVLVSMYEIYVLDRQTDRQADRQTDRQIDRQTYRQTDKQTDRQTDNLHTHVGPYKIEGAIHMYICGWQQSTLKDDSIVH